MPIMENMPMKQDAASMPMYIKVNFSLTDFNTGSNHFCRINQLPKRLLFVITV